MSGGGGKGGSRTQTQEVKLPEWVNREGQENVRLARAISKIGPILAPEELPTTAAFTPMQLASMENTGQAAAAFGTAGGNLSPMAGMPVPTQFAGGITGYSAAPMTTAALQGWQADAPAQYDFVRSFWNDPVSGVAGSNAAPTGAFSSGFSSASPLVASLTDMERRMGLTPEAKARGMTAADYMGA